MSITIRCSECGKGYQVADEKAGLRMRCVQCQTLIAIPVPERKASRKPAKKKVRSRLERTIVWTGIALLLILAGVELHARHGYTNTLAAFQAAARNDEAHRFSFADAKSMVSGWPVARTGYDWIAYRWPSLIHTYKIRLTVDEERFVLAVDTQFDESDLQSKAMVARATTKPRNQSEKPLDNSAKPETAAGAGVPLPAAGEKAITALQTAGRFFQKSGDSQLFRRRLQVIANELPELPVSTERGKPLWNTITVNSWQTGVDAFKFKSPLTVPADMYWCFSVPQDTGTWYIIPTSGEMQGFVNYDFRRNQQYAGVELPVENVVIHQSLLGGAIQPGQEYIIWDVPSKNEPAVWHVAISLVPQGQAPQASQSEPISSIMGLESPGVDFPPTLAGMNAALRVAASLGLNGRKSDSRFARLLIDVSSQFAEIDLSHDEQVQWNSLTAGEDGTRFCAVRFTSHAEKAQGLQAMFSSPRLLRDWGVIESETAVQFKQSDLGIEVDSPLSIPGTDAGRVVALYHLAGNTIAPGKEYIFWFNTWNDEPVDIRFAARLIVDEPAETAADARQSTARAFGFDVSQPPTADRVDATLTAVRQMALEHGSTSHIDPLLRSIAAALPEVEAGATNAEPVWHRIESSAAGTAAVRFTSSLDAPAEASSAFITTGVPLLWGIVPLERIAGVSSTTDLRDQNVLLNGLEFPAHNVVSYQSYKGLTIEPKKSYVYWCVFKEAEPAAAATPLESRLALHLAADAGDDLPRTPRAAASTMGIHHQQPAAPEGSVLLGEHDDESTGVQFLPGDRQLITVGRGGTICSWDLDAKTRLAQHQNPFGDIDLLKLSADGSRLAVASRAGNKIAVWQVDDFQHLSTVSGEWDRMVTFALSPDGTELATFSGQKDAASGFYIAGALELWKADTGERIRGSDTNLESHLSLQYAADGKQILSVGVRIPGDPDQARNQRWGSLLSSWDRETLTQSLVQWGDLDNLVGIGQSQDGERLITAGFRGLLQLRDRSSGSVKASLAQASEINGLACSPDCKLAAIGCSDSAVRLWNTAENRIVREWRVHTRQINAVDISQDSRWVASVSNDGTVRLWDINHQTADAAAEFAAPITNSIGMPLVPVLPGEFQMGAPPADDSAEQNERPQRRVKITRPFYLGRHEVTVKQFREFVTATQYATSAERSGQGSQYLDLQTYEFGFRPELNWQKTRFEQTDEHPVVNVSRDDALEFCKWLSQKESKAYRLPTEAEWEYACRAGSQSRWSTGENDFGLSYAANTADASLQTVLNPANVGAGWWDDRHQYTAPVGTYAANALGLYDMHGNVFEWCLDLIAEAETPPDELVDPRGPETGKGYIVRGGAFFYRSSFARSSHREYSDADEAAESVGFRVVQEIPAQPGPPPAADDGQQR